MFGPVADSWQADLAPSHPGTNGEHGFTSAMIHLPGGKVPQCLDFLQGANRWSKALAAASMMRDEVLA